MLAHHCQDPGSGRGTALTLFMTSRWDAESRLLECLISPGLSAWLTAGDTR